MSKVVDILNKILSVMFVLILLLTGYVFVSVIRTEKGKVPQAFGYSFLRVATGSMEPTIPTDSLVIMHAQDPDTIQKGDIICFYSNDPIIKDLPNTHRVLDIQNGENGLEFITKGDANAEQDAYSVPADRLVGVYVNSFKVGDLMKKIQSPTFMFIAFMALAVVIFFEIIGIKKRATNKAESTNGKDS